MVKQSDTDITQSSGKVFNKTSISARFFGLSVTFSVDFRLTGDGFPSARDKTVQTMPTVGVFDGLNKLPSR